MKTQQDHILIVDDDAQIRSLLADHLVKHEFRVSGAANGREMRNLLQQSRIDLIVLDLLLPEEDGLTLFRQLRAGAHASVPVVMLTALGDDVDRIIGLELGADDYVPKPFTPRELVARIRSVLRRSRMLPPGQSAGHALRYASFAQWTVDCVERVLIASNGTLSLLNMAEYALLLYLLDRPQQVVTRDQLLIHLSGRDAEAFDRSIDLRVSRLRRHLGQDTAGGEYIKTVRNEGYVFCKTVTRHAQAPKPGAGAGSHGSAS